MTQRTLTIAGIASVGLIATIAPAATINVPADYASIQDAIDAAVDGDAVVIAPGTYVELIDLDKNITVRSVDRDPTTVIIDGNGLGTTVEFGSGLTDDAKLVGVTVTGGNGGTGGGIDIPDGDPIVRKCIIRDNFANTGGGISTGSIDNIGGGPLIEQCLIYDNTSNAGGAAIYMSDPGNPTVANCVITQNTGGGSSTCFALSDAIVAYRNCILGNNATPAEFNGNTGGVNDVQYSLIQDGWAGTGNISGSPQFVDGVNHDFRISAGSPCIDAGDNTVLNPGILEDISGGKRYWHDPQTPNTGNGVAPIIDMGAYEFPPRVRYVDLNAKGAGDGLTWEDAYTDLNFAIADFSNDSGVDEIWVAAGVYHPDFGTGDRFSSFVIAGGLEIYGGFTSGELFVDERDYDANETILSGAIGAAGIADNSYHVVTMGSTADASTKLDGFIIQKGYADGTDGGAGVWCKDGTEGRIVNCWIRLNEGPEYGNGILVEGGSSPTILRCSINANSGSQGVYVDNSSPVFVSCRIAGNSGDVTTAGIGMFFLDAVDAVVANCTVYGNTATNAGAFNGGVHSFNGTLTIVNSIIWANTAPTSSLLFNNHFWNSTTVDMKNTTVEGGYYDYQNSMTNNGVDPRFVDLDGPNNVMGDADDDFSLLPRSRCIDSGDLSLMPGATGFDFDDNTRHIDDAGMPDYAPGNFVDRGCLEYQGLSCAYDCDQSGSVGVGDLLVLLADWGGPGVCDVEPAGGDDVVAIAELLGLLAAWGPCP